MRYAFTGQELYTYSGTLVFITNRVEVDRVTIAEMGSGLDHWGVIDENLLESATPEELEEAGI